MNTPLSAELNLRADKKRREGYYDDPSFDSMDGLGQSTQVSPEPFKRESVMAALEDDGGPDWFFWPSTTARTVRIDQFEKQIKRCFPELSTTIRNARVALILSSFLDDTLPMRVKPGRAS